MDCRYALRLGNAICRISHLPYVLYQEFRKISNTQYKYQTYPRRRSPCVEWYLREPFLLHAVLSNLFHTRGSYCIKIGITFVWMNAFDHLSNFDWVEFYQMVQSTSLILFIWLLAITALGFIESERISFSSWNSRWTSMCEVMSAIQRACVWESSKVGDPASSCVRESVSRRAHVREISSASGELS